MVPISPPGRSNGARCPDVVCGRAPGAVPLLVIMRRPGQTFWVGEDVEIKVFESASGMLRIGIEAPAEVEIMRGELLSSEEQMRLSRASNRPSGAGTNNVALRPIFRRRKSITAAPP